MAALDIFDIIASIILMFTMMRRVSVRFAQPEQFPAVEPGRFALWRERALAAYAFVAWVCGIKVVVNTSWAFFAIGRVPDALVRSVGLGMFVIWVVLVVKGWRRVTDAKADGRDLGIEMGTLKAPKDGPDKPR